MFFNIIWAFIIPWTIGILHLNKRDKLVIPLIGSFCSVLSFVINEIGFHFDFFEVMPLIDEKNTSALPFIIGLYPILGSYLIFFIRKFQHPFLIIFLMTLLTTFLELTFVYFGIVKYYNGWNGYYTFVSYLLPYILAYRYYLFLDKTLNLYKK
ncbi:hypothetical protein ABNX05_01065 [Lysinibacillus sp. M3]|uniref:Uncharacterized protein n=1 Tax=Lysinibacillus zambalensis TaxID=3160866 RepID=A0ABV1ML20_9BACI